MYIRRELATQIQPFLSRKEVISLVGPRQSGKTTLVQHLADEMTGRGKKIKFITFENKNDLALFQNSIDDFKEIAVQFDCVIIDEFQYAADGGQELKSQTGKYMVGRMFDFELLPFSFREYLTAEDPELFNLLEKKFSPSALLDFDVSKGFGKEINRRISSQLEKYAVYGGYPAGVTAAPPAEKKKKTERIAKNYLLKEIKGLFNL